MSPRAGASGPSPTALLQASPDGVAAFDRELRCTAWNAAMERLTGVPAARALGRPAPELLPFLREDGELDLLLRALEGEAATAPDRPGGAYGGGRGGWVEARWAPLPGGAGRVLGAMAVVRDVTARRAAEEAGQRRAVEILEGMTDGFAAFDHGWRYTYLNQQAERLGGRPRAELLGRVLWDVYPQGVGTPGYHALQRAMRDRVPAEYTEYYPLVDLWLEVRAFPTPGGLALYTRDVSETRRAEAALRESERRFRTLADSAPVMIWLSDTRNLGTWFNRRWLEFTGRPLEAELGAGWVETVHPDDVGRAAAYCQAQFDQRREFRMEFRMRRADGEWRWLTDHGVPRYDADGAFLGYIGSCMDVTDLKRAEESLRLSEERYRSLVEASTKMVWHADARGALADMPAWRALTGQTKEETRDGGWAGAIHPDDRVRVLEAWWKAIDTHAPYEAEYRVRLADGGYRWFASRGVPVLQDGGTVREWVGTLTDVHDRRTADALRDAERERLRRVLAQIPAAVAVYEGPDHLLVAMTDQYHRIVGRREVLGRPLREVIPELVEQGFVALLDRVYATGVAESGTAARADWDDDGDGRVEEHLIDFVYQPFRDAAGRVQGVVAHVTEVSARERAAREIVEARSEAEGRAAEAAALAAQLGRQAAALEAEVEASARLAAELQDANRELQAASERAEQARRRIEILDQASSALASSLDFQATVSTVARLAVPLLADWCFVEMRQADGSIRLIAVGHPDPAMVELAHDTLRRYPVDPDAPWGTPKVLRTAQPELVPEITDEMLRAVAQDEEHLRTLLTVGFRSHLSVPLVVRGEAVGVLSLVYAASGRRYSEADLPLARELAHRASVAIDNARLYGEALAANQAKAGFLATMSHELRTPLNAMLGYVDLLLMGIPEAVPERAGRQVERIGLASRHLLSIIEEILAFSRLEAGRETVEPEAVDLPGVVGEVSAIIEPLAAEKGLEFRVPERVQPERVVTDPRKLRQVLVNLLGNAVKFTRAGSVCFEVEEVDGSVCLRVRDTGPGIAPEHRELIFEPFRQVDSEKTRAAGGTGLGLAVSRRLARLLGGDVTVESTLGEGSVFTLRLPMESA